MKFFIKSALNEFKVILLEKENDYYNVLESNSEQIQIGAKLNVPEQELITFKQGLMHLSFKLGALSTLVHNLQEKHEPTKKTKRLKKIR